MSNQEDRRSPFEEGGMFNGAHPLIFERAKELRKGMTASEKLLWHYLKTGIGGMKCRRQHSLGIYIVDFYVHAVKLIVELDGGIHAREDVKMLDEQRERDLKQWGYIIVRFKNKEVSDDVEKVLLTIKEKVEGLKVLPLGRI